MPPTRERFTAAFELKGQDQGKRTFEGALSTSHLDDGDGRYRDIVHPGAFKRTLEHFRNAKSPYVPLIDSHAGNSVMNVYGHLLDAEEQMTGKTLRYEMAGGGMHEVPEMLLNTKWKVIDGIDGERLLDRMRPGSVRKMSMGYNTQKHDFTDLKSYGKARNLREVALREGSLVIFPMNQTADVDTASIKSLVDAVLAGTLTDDQKAEIRALPDAAKNEFRALLDAPPAGTPADTPKGLAPDDPRRIEFEATIRTVKLRCLATRNTDPARA